MPSWDLASAASSAMPLSTGTLEGDGVVRVASACDIVSVYPVLVHGRLQRSVLTIIKTSRDDLEQLDKDLDYLWKVR